jgi:hypothetical protein
MSSQTPNDHVVAVLMPHMEASLVGEVDEQRNTGSGKPGTVVGADNDLERNVTPGFDVRPSRLSNSGIWCDRRFDGDR